jgi:hypothetical protein
MWAGAGNELECRQGAWIDRIVTFSEIHVIPLAQLESHSVWGNGGACSLAAPTRRRALATG